MAKTERLRRSFFPQAIRLLNTNSVSQTFTRHKKKKKKNIHILIIRIAAMCTYPVQPVCTFLSSLLFILLFIKSHILFLHILLVFAHLTCLAHLVLHFSLFYYTFYSLFLFFTYIYALVWCYFYIIFILCTVH